VKIRTNESAFCKADFQTYIEDERSSFLTVTATLIRPY